MCLAQTWRMIWKKIHPSSLTTSISYFDHTINGPKLPKFSKRYWFIPDPSGFQQMLDYDGDLKETFFHTLSPTLRPPPLKK